MKIYGPYKGKDNRWRIVTIDGNIRRTISYPRYIVESYLGVRLESYEDVHHIDGNPDNNNISNLDVVLHSDHVRNHSTKYREDLVTKCVYCGKELILTPLQQRSRYQDRNRTKGPFCSKQCSGRYGTDVQRAAKLGNLG